MTRTIPAWAMGLALAPMGFYYGFVSTALPVLLRAHGSSVEQIAWVSSVGFSPTFWAFLLCPILDVRFSKRAYALFFAAVAAICLGLSTMLTADIPVFTAVVTLGCTAAVLFSTAHQGWMPDAVEGKHYSAVGGVSQVANLGAAGIFAWGTVHLVRTLPPAHVALLLAVLAMLPTLLLFFIPLPTQSLRSARETFRTFFGDLYQVCKQRECLVGLTCFLLPTACFALTNLFAALGSDFHTSEEWVTKINGPLVALVCSAGSLLGIWICRHIEHRLVYICTGFGAALAALAMIYTPHTLPYFAAGVLTYNFFTGINYTAFSAMCYQIVGSGNPLAATQMALLTAAANLPISYMTTIDGHLHTTHGLAGMLAIDAITTLIVGGALLFGLSWMQNRTSAPAAS